jgi:hypothetical protein
MDASGIWILEKIAADIDTISFENSEAWEAMGVQLQSAIDNIPDQKPELPALLRSCQQALQTIAKNEAADTFAYIEAISEAVNAAVLYLQDNPQGGKRLADAQDGLGRALRIAIDDPDSEVAVAPIQSTESSQISLKEILATLKQDDLSDAELEMELSNMFAVMQKIIAGLKVSVQKMHDNPELIKILNLCSNIMEGLAQIPITEVPGRVEDISKALDAIEHHLGDNTDQDRPSLHTIMNLQSVLRSKIQEHESAIAPSFTSICERNFSLHDAAAKLIQLEADDLSGIADLQMMLVQIAEHESIRPNARKYIEQAIRQMETIDDNAVSDAEDILAEVGKLIEAALDAAEAPSDAPAKSIFLVDGSETRCTTSHQGEIQSDPQPNRPGLNTEQLASRQPNDEDPAFDYMPQDIDPELFMEFIASAMI